MLQRALRPLGLGVLLTFVLTGSAAPVFGRGEAATLVSVLPWRIEDPRFGGLSGLRLDAGGTAFVAITDRAAILTGRLRREEGRIVAVEEVTILPLRDRQGRELAGFNADSEGLAVAPDGSLVISFEGNHRVVRYPAPGAGSQPLRRHPDFAGLKHNSSLEAVAVDAAGTIYTLPERSGAWDRPFPVWRFDGTAWSQPFALPRHGIFLPVDADFGPDGRFYLLERGFSSIFGFSTRIRRFTLDGDRVTDEETLLETPAGKHPNIEGLSVWRDAEGALRLTMISDDNFLPLLPFQATEFIEYRIPVADAARAE